MVLENKPPTPERDPDELSSEEEIAAVKKRGRRLAGFWRAGANDEVAYRDWMDRRAGRCLRQGWFETFRLRDLFGSVGKLKGAKNGRQSIHRWLHVSLRPTLLMAIGSLP